MAGVPFGACAIAALLLAFPAAAQQVNPPNLTSIAPTRTSTTVGTSAAAVTLPASTSFSYPYRVYLLMHLPGSGDVSCRFDGGTAALHGGNGEISLTGEGATWVWVLGGPTPIPQTAAPNCVAASAGTVVTWWSVP